MLRDAGLFGRVGGELHADELIEQLRVLLFGDFAARLTRDVGDVQIELGLADRLAIDRGDPLGALGCAGRGILAARDQQHERGEQTSME